MDEELNATAEVVAPSEGVDPAPSEPTVEAASEGGQVEVTEPVVEPEVTEPPAAIDLDEYGNHVVPIKVDGEETHVPLAELRNGYMRQADYTKKTQEVAFWQQVDTALRNPATAPAAMQYLQETFGVQAANQVAAQAAEPQVDPIEEITDPVERRLATIESHFEAQAAAQQRDQATQILNNTIAELSSRYDDFDAQAVVSAAVHQGISDPAQLETVYKLMAFDKLKASTDAQAQVASQKQAEEAARQAAAAQAAQVVGSGASANSGDVGGTVTTSKPKTVREAFAQAKLQHGG